MTIAEISDKILDENFGLDISHSEGSDETPSEYFVEEKINDALTHYGILGMKWGIRRTPEQLGNKVVNRRKKDQRYEDETDAEYQARMQREFSERAKKQVDKQERKIQKDRIKADAATQKRQLKFQERQQAMQIKAVEKQRKEQVKAQEKQRKEQLKEQRNSVKQKTKSKPTDPRNLTDRELNDAITRLRNEQTYKQLSVDNKPFMKRTATKAAAIGGGLLLTVGTAVIKKQLTDVGNLKVEELLKKKGINTGKGKGKGLSEDDVRQIFNDMFNNP